VFNLAIIKTSKNKIKSQKALYNAIKYISNTAKTAVISMGDGSIFTTANDVADTFQMVRKIHDKNDGRLAHHFIFSFPSSEKINAEQAHKVALQLVKQAFPNYESVVAIHNDCKHLHAHIILNAVNTKTGMKYCDNKASLHYLRNLSNEICKRYGLSVLPKISAKEGVDQATIHAKNSWKKDLLKILDRAILSCKSRTEFINFVNKNGYECRYTGANIVRKKVFELTLWRNNLGQNIRKLNSTRVRLICCNL
jgi:hypothetical protein